MSLNESIVEDAALEWFGDAFVTSKLDVVLALVREISKPLPFFSRLNLMREGQRIERLGYRVNYHRIEVK